MLLHGSAELRFLGTEFAAQIMIDLSSGQIEVWFARPTEPMPLEQWLALSENADFELKNILLATPYGELRLGKYTDYFVLRHEPACGDAREKTQNGGGVFLEGASIVSHQVLQPRHSLLEFEHSRQPAGSSASEVVLEASIGEAQQKFPLQVRATTCQAQIAGNLLTVSGHPLERAEIEDLRYALGAVCGGPASVRTIRMGQTLSINVAPHDRSKSDHLWTDREDIPKLIQGFLALFSGSEDETRKLRRAVHFHVHGLGDDTLLDHRIINLYTELEILDGARTLSKEKVSSLLDISIDEAALLCEVRHALVHGGSSISEGVLSEVTELRKHKPTFAVPEIILDTANRSRTASSYYFRFAGLLNQYWAKRIGFVGKVNDFSHLRKP